MINNFPIPLNPTKGGTGLTSVTTGSLLYGSSTNVWSQLSIGSTGQVLQVSSGVPSWSSDIAGVGTGRTIYGGIASGTLTLLSSGDVSNYGSLSLSPGGATITGNLYSVLVATTGELKYVRSGLTKLHVEGEIKTGVTGMMVSSDATLTPTRMLEVRSTSAQIRVGYDASNYAEFAVGSAGGTTFSSTASSISTTRHFTSVNTAIPQMTLTNNAGVGRLDVWHDTSAGTYYQNFTSTGHYFGRGTGGGSSTFSGGVRLDYLSGASGEFPVGGFISPGKTGHDLTITPISAGTAGRIVVGAYFNGLGWLSALEWGHVASGYGNLKLMKSGGVVGIGMGATTPARALEVRSTSAQQRWSCDGSNYAEITVNSTGDLVFSQSTSTYSLNICGTLGSSSTNCVVIGRGASVPASSDKCTVVGYANTVTGTGRRVAFGSGNTVTDGSLAGYPQAALGVGNTCSEGYATVVGHSCSISSGGHSSFVGGRACSTAYDSNVIIGYNCIGGANFSILLGRGVTNTAAYQFVAGSGSYPMTNVFFGGGVTHATPTAWTLNGTGGAGTDISGGALQIAGGKGTGNAAGGSVKIQASTAGASGTTLQTLATVAEFGPATIGFYGVTPVARPAAYTQTYSTADRTLSAYTADDESVAYTGAGDGEAQLADLNALRTAYENLRAFVEDIAQMLNSVTDDLQSVGLLQ